jgi:hypothetical protein
MANIKQSYQATDTLTITLASLANGSGRCSTALDNTSNLDITADVGVKVTTSGTSATGYVSVYLVRSYDGTSYDDAFGGTDGAFTPINAYFLGTIATPATSTYYKTFDLGEYGLTLPKKWAIAIVNSTGNALTATAGNHEVKVTRKFYTV